MKFILPTLVIVLLVFCASIGISMSYGLSFDHSKGIAAIALLLVFFSVGIGVAVATPFGTSQ